MIGMAIDNTSETNSTLMIALNVAEAMSKI